MNVSTTRPRAEDGPWAWPKSLTAEQWQLVADNLHLVGEAMNFMPRAPRDRSDEEHDGFPGLLRAAAWYDPARGPFAPFARFMIRQAITWARQQHFSLRALHVDDPTRFVDVIPTSSFAPPDVPDEATMRRAHALIAPLSPKQQRIILADSHRQLADELGMKADSVRTGRLRLIRGLRLIEALRCMASAGGQSCGGAEQ